MHCADICKNTRSIISISGLRFGEEEQGLVKKVLESGIAFGARIRQAVGTQFAVAVANGTAALHLALLANGIGPSDEVITSPFTFIASAHSVFYTTGAPGLR